MKTKEIQSKPDFSTLFYIPFGPVKTTEIKSKPYFSATRLAETVRTRGPADSYFAMPF